MTFGRMGFVQTGQTAHAGYDRPTSITMRRAILPSPASFGRTSDGLR